MHGDNAVEGRIGLGLGGDGEICLGLQLHGAVAIEDAFTERDGRDVAFANRARRHDEVQPARRRAGLVWMADDAGVHHRGRLVAVFMAEIGADQGPVVFIQRVHAALDGLDLLEAIEEDAARLPVTTSEVAVDDLQFGTHLVAVQCHDGVANPRHPRHGAHGAVTRIDGYGEGQDDNALGIGAQGRRADDHVGQGKIPCSEKGVGCGMIFSFRTRRSFRSAVLRLVRRERAY